MVISHSPWNSRFQDPSRDFFNASSGSFAVGSLEDFRLLYEVEAAAERLEDSFVRPIQTNTTTANGPIASVTQIMCQERFMPIVNVQFSLGRFGSLGFAFSGRSSRDSTELAEV